MVWAKKQAPSRFHLARPAADLRIKVCNNAVLQERSISRPFEKRLRRATVLDMLCSTLAPDWFRMLR
jgi:hypothetical protein